MNLLEENRRGQMVEVWTDVYVPGLRIQWEFGQGGLRFQKADTPSLVALATGLHTPPYGSDIIKRKMCTRKAGSN